MKAALIPTIPDLDVYGHGEIHLVLSHLLQYTKYLEHYQKQADFGSHVILDNSAHELRKGQVFSRLLTQANELHADEVVVPDELFSSGGTLDGLKESLKYLSTEEGVFAFCDADSPQLMIVPQGADEQDYEDCFYQMLEAITDFGAATRYPLKIKWTLGVSKDYEIFRGGLRRILENLVLPQQESMQYEIHMLGLGREFLQLKSITTDLDKYIRSIDSAKPLVYAYRGIEFNKSTIGYPGRPMNYFEECSCSMNGTSGLAKRNIDFYKELVNAT